IASVLAIVLCVAVFGAILLQKASIPVPAPAPPQATPTEGRAPGSVVTVADSAAESAVAAPVAAAPTWPMPSAMPTVDQCDECDEKHDAARCGLFGAYRFHYEVAQPGGIAFAALRELNNQFCNCDNPRVLAIGKF